MIFCDLYAHILIKKSNLSTGFGVLTNEKKKHNKNSKKPHRINILKEKKNFELNKLYI